MLTRFVQDHVFCDIEPKHQASKYWKKGKDKQHVQASKIYKFRATQLPWENGQGL